MLMYKQQWGYVWLLLLHVRIIINQTYGYTIVVFIFTDSLHLLNRHILCKLLCISHMLILVIR